MSGTLAVLAILASLGLGYYLYQSLGSGPANGTYDALATVSSALWVLTGIFAILGGFVIVGMLIIAIFSYLAMSKGSATKQRLRAKLAE